MDNENLLQKVQKGGQWNKKYKGQILISKEILRECKSNKKF
jgi:hypothetical protein